MSVQLAGAIPIPLDTIRAGFHELGRYVTISLRTQQGDAARLGHCRHDCLHFLQLVHQVFRMLAIILQFLISSSMQLYLLQKNWA